MTTTRTPDDRARAAARAALGLTIRPEDHAPVASPAATLIGVGPDDLGRTIDVAAQTHVAHGGAEAGDIAGDATSAGVRGRGALRTTVLPRVEHAAGAVARFEDRPRFEDVGLLGRGGVGEVRLVRDLDIERTVAVKRLLPAARGDDAVLRFAEEVRAVGQLEHPGIVPVYDVGLEPDGAHYLVMKHVRGETLETVIERLRAGDAAYRERFTFVERARVFLGILQAMRYAHEQGLLHRDLKPANVMVGPFGEVTVMDWGLAKRLRRDAAAAPATPGDAAASPTAAGDAAARGDAVRQTRAGALVGTPLYMSPEQAAGEHDRVDERSDVFALCLLFHELLSLHHPLEDACTVPEVVARLVGEDLDIGAMHARGMAEGAPIEYLQFAEGGLARDPAARYPSVAAMEERLRALLAGRFAVRCHVSFAKRAGYAYLHWVDRHPMLYTGIAAALVLLALAGLVATGIWLAAAL